MSTCLLSKYSAYWPINGLNTVYIYHRKCKPLRNNASPSNTNNAHISRTTTRTPKISSPMCSPCRCGHFDIFSLEMFNLFCSKLPKGGILCFHLRPARTYLTNARPVKNCKDCRKPSKIGRTTTHFSTPGNFKRFHAAMKNGLLGLMLGLRCPLWKAHPCFICATSLYQGSKKSLIENAV